LSSKMKTAWTDHLTVRPPQRADVQQQQRNNQSEMTAHWTRSIRRSFCNMPKSSKSGRPAPKCSKDGESAHVFTTVEEVGHELQQVRQRKLALTSKVAEMEREVAEVRMYKDITLDDIKLSYLALKGKLRKIQNPLLHRQLQDTMADELGCAMRKQAQLLAFESQLWGNLCTSIQRAHRFETGRVISGLSLAEREKVELETYISKLREDVRIANERWRDLVEQRPLADVRAAQVVEAETGVNASKDTLKELMLKCAAVQARAHSAQDTVVHLSQSQCALLDEREATSEEFVYMQSCTSEVIRERAKDNFIGRLRGEGGRETDVDSFATRTATARPPGRQMLKTQTAALAAVGQVLVPTVDYTSQGKDILEALESYAERLVPNALPLVTKLDEELRRMQTNVDVAVEQEHRMNQALVGYVQDQITIDSRAIS
jgi:hypothetical protein